MSEGIMLPMGRHAPEISPSPGWRSHQHAAQRGMATPESILAYDSLR